MIQLSGPTPPDNRPTTENELDTIINECLDLEAQGLDQDALRLMRKAVADHPGFGARLAATRAAVSRVRQPVFVPDTGHEVLSQVNQLRPFISPRRRRQISASRVAIAAGVVLTLTVMGLLQRTYPEATNLSPDPAPVANVVDASRADAAASVRSLVSAVQDLRQGMTNPVADALGAGRRRHGVLALGDTTHYEASKWGLSVGSLASEIPFRAPLGALSDPQVYSYNPIAVSLFPVPSLLEQPPVTASFRTDPPLGQVIDSSGVLDLQPRPPLLSKPKAGINK